MPVCVIIRPVEVDVKRGRLGMTVFYSGNSGNSTIGIEYFVIVVEFPQTSVGSVRTIIDVKLGKLRGGFVIET